MKIVSACFVFLAFIGSATASRADVTATPVISLATGTYAMPTSTTITDSTPGASIQWCYTVTGTCTPAMAYSGSIYVDPATTESICANATATATGTSATVCSYYTAAPAPTATPVINLASGTYVITATDNTTTPARTIQQIQAVSLDGSYSVALRLNDTLTSFASARAEASSVARWSRLRSFSSCLRSVMSRMLHWMTRWPFSW